MKKRIKIDTLTNFKLLNRYLGLVTVKKYENTFSYKKVGKKAYQYQKVASTHKSFSVQWKNIANDLRGIFINPFAYAPQIALSVLAFWFIFHGEHKKAFDFAFMGAITLDGTVVSSNNTGTFSVTVASNSDRMMIVSYATYQGGGPSGVTYNSDALTKIVEKVGSFSEQCSIWGKVAPATGTHNVVVSGGGDWNGVGAYSLYNCDQNLPSTTHTSGGSGSGTSDTIVTLVDNSWVITCIEAEPVITSTTSGGTEDWNLEGQSFQHGAGQHILKATAGSQAMTSSLSYGARWNQCSIELKVVSAGAPSTAVQDVIDSEGIIPFAR